MSEPRVLEIGGGAVPRYRPNLDVRPMPTVDIVADLNGLWPVENSSYDLVYSRYCIEHVSWRRIENFIAETARVLAPGGKVTIITANAEAQMKWALARPEWDEKIGQCIFGDMDYPENSHKAALNPSYAIKLFRDAGFTDVFVFPEGEFGTDMVIEARKPMSEIQRGAAQWTPAERRVAYDRRYFDGGRGPVGGYAREGYWDYPVHWVTFREIMKRKPSSVLELGCARGYILKRLQDAGITAKGLEVSRHCLLTRACDGIELWDLTQTPWPFKDGEFDLCFSAATLEHIPEEAVPRVVAEINRVSKRGLHGVDFGDHDDGFDKTHCTFHPALWWQHKLNPNSVTLGIAEDKLNEYLPQEVVEKDQLELPPYNPPTPDGLVKLNIGCFTTMFHHGWQNVDIIDLRNFAYQHGFIFRQIDLRAGLPHAQDSVDLIFASHVIEHFTYLEGQAILGECRRVMKQGAVMRIILPDASRLCRYYLSLPERMNELDELNEGAAGTPHLAGKLWELLFSGHQAIYDADAAYHVLKGAGFEAGKISKVSFREGSSKQLLAETLDLLPDISMYVEAVK